jgi:hypothetical protein
MKMKKRTASILAGIVLLLFVSPILFWAISTKTDIYPKSKGVHFKKLMISKFWELRGVDRRECKHVEWSFIAIADYEPTELLQNYGAIWNRMPKPGHPALAGSIYRGRFFAIFSFITPKFELSMEKYLGYTTQNIPLKEHTVGTHLYICRLDNWY